MTGFDQSDEIGPENERIEPRVEHVPQQPGRFHRPPRSEIDFRKEPHRCEIAGDHADLPGVRGGGVLQVSRRLLSLAEPPPCIGIIRFLAETCRQVSASLGRSVRPHVKVASLTGDFRGRAIDLLRLPERLKSACGVTY